VRVPTLILVGREDALTPPAQSEKMAKGITGARLVTLDGAGHMANLEAAAPFNATVREFVLGLGAPTM
jgi:pimeloyl-ACP methyl ester carboxylesterase